MRNPHRQWRCLTTAFCFVLTIWLTLGVVGVAEAQSSSIAMNYNPAPVVGTSETIDLTLPPAMNGAVVILYLKIGPPLHTARRAQARFENRRCFQPKPAPCQQAHRVVAHQSGEDVMRCARQQQMVVAAGTRHERPFRRVV